VRQNFPGPVNHLIPAQEVVHAVGQLVTEGGLVSSQFLAQTVRLIVQGGYLGFYTQEV
jgi:hypothetical protein